MRITLRPYFKDRSRFQVDLQFTDPTTNAPVRARPVAPKGLTERQAHTWGMGELAKLLRGQGNLTTAPTIHREESAPIPPAPKYELTLEVFYRDNFTPNYVRLQRSATQTAYDTLWRHHLSKLGSLPLAAIDAEAVDRFKADLKEKGLEASTVNLVLSKLARILRWALKHKKLSAIPEIEKLKVERRERAHYTVEQIELIRAVFGRLSPEDAVVFLLAFEAGLRTGEIAALRWEDIDHAHGVIKVRRTIYRGTEGPPKGTVGDVGLTDNLIAALQRLERRGPRVLYRRSHHTGGQHADNTEHSVRAALNRMQREAGLDLTGLHILRHSGITFLADQGADVHELRAFARHSRLQTTETYIHSAKQRLARSAASRFNGNAVATPGNPT